MLKLLLFLLPLSLDTFAVSAALGLGGLSRRERLRASLVLSLFELGMPVVGLLAGHGLGDAIGGVAEIAAAVGLLALGLWLLLADEEAEEERVAALPRTRGLALLGLGLSVSLDELAIGFTIGLLGLSVPLALALIGAQAFLVAQLGLRLGARLGEAAREGAERLAGVALIGLGVLILVEAVA